MKLWKALSNAAAGWVQLLAGDAGWRARFNLSAAGLMTALAIFLFVLFLAVMIVAMVVGSELPGGFAIAAGVFTLALPLVAMVVTLVGTRRAVGSSDPLRDMLVPGVYALVAFIILEGLLVTLIGGPVVVLAWLALGYLLYRLARAATSWPVALSVGYAVLTVLLLVTMRQALYMLSSSPGTPT